MNTLARQVSLAAILSALLVLSGCSTTDTARRTPAKAPVQVTVVERGSN
jgi:predicted component of type VI protein secretion system